LAFAHFDVRKQLYELLPAWNGLRGRLSWSVGRYSCGAAHLASDTGDRSAAASPANSAESHLNVWYPLTSIASFEGLDPNTAGFAIRLPKK
jgi:hypothetical protein